ncbi:MAG: hypothetical protein K6G47_03270 [Clostridia bacterium]|nr:hypothetical protein [Clostridia bacterium]
MGWKFVRGISSIFLALFAGFVLFELYKALSYSGTYPYPSIAGEITNWWDRFTVGVLIFWPFYIVPLVAAVVLLIISCIKIRKQ